MFKAELRKLLLSEHSRSMAERVVNEIGDDPVRARALVELLDEGDYRLTQRASWPLGIIGEQNHHVLKPFLHELVLKLQEPAHPALHRNIVRLFESAEIPEAERGLLAEACFHFLYTAETPIAIRCFSMSVLHRICLAEPELANELCLYIEDRMPYESPGFRSRGKKILAYWQKRRPGSSR